MLTLMRNSIFVMRKSRIQPSVIMERPTISKEN